VHGGQGSWIWICCKAAVSRCRLSTDRHLWLLAAHLQKLPCVCHAIADTAHQYLLCQHADNWLKLGTVIEGLVRLGNAGSNGEDP
jgi:hypothetical protein